MSAVSGRCHCGAVTYSVSGEIGTIVNCHCDMCRNMNGTAFSSYAIVDRADLSVEHGQEALRQYAVTETGIKYYCAECGTPLFNTNVEKYGDHAMLYLGTLRAFGDLPAPVNIFYEDRLAWTGSVADLASFARLPER